MKKIYLVPLVMVLFFASMASAEKFQPQHSVYQFGYQDEGRDFIRNDLYFEKGGVVLNVVYINVLEKSISAKNYNDQNKKDVSFVLGELSENGFNLINESRVKEKSSSQLVVYVGMEPYSSDGLLSTDESTVWILKQADYYQVYFKTWSNEAFMKTLNIAIK